MNNIVVEKEKWLEARRALLQLEKAHMRANDALKKNLRALPWLRIEKNYVFTTLEGEKSLAELFRGRSQLFMKHFMMAPGQDWQCVGCSLECDHMNGLLPHLENHDIAYVAVARAPIGEIEKVRQRMGWDFCWVSSSGSEFNYDMNVSFRPEQLKSGSAQYNFRSYRGDRQRHRGTLDPAPAFHGNDGLLGPRPRKRVRKEPNRHRVQQRRCREFFGNAPR